MVAETGALKRIFTFLFAIYMVALTLAPCGDRDFPQPDSRVVTCQNDQTAQHSHEDCCSPFCTCNCCSLPVMMVRQFTIVMVPTRPEELKTPPVIQRETGYSVVIWEPPKTC